ncbi:MAG: M23 family metallopeptidase [Pseudomonadota bacterium]
MQRNEIVIDPPLAGHWVIYNPPGHPGLAYDFLAEDRKKSLYRRGGFLRHLFSFISVEDTLTWSSPVYSPVDGVVVESHDAEVDRKRISFAYDLVSLLLNKPEVANGFGAFGGNHVMIQAEGYFVLLCHLKKGSLIVKEGDQVTAGQKVGEVGNSGSSIQPHLHVQVMSDEKIFPLFANLVPFRISRAKVMQDRDWILQQNIQPKNRAHYLFERIDV